MIALASIHDVTPAFFDRVRRLWDLVSAQAVIPALLVVPDWHGECPIERHAAFVDWLRIRAADGAEIFLHGERHDEVGLPRSLGDHWRAWGRTAREGEFLTLESSEARARIERGLTRLRGLGLEPVGFVPPAWLAREATFEAARGLGLEFSEDDRFVLSLPDRRRIAAPAFRWSTRTVVRAGGSVVVAKGRSFFQRGAPVIRLALHPPDLDHPAVARSVVRTLGRLLETRSFTRYAELRRSDSGIQRLAGATA